jgi:hypothetical protein
VVKARKPPRGGNGGRPLKFALVEVERALRANAGNATAAAAALNNAAAAAGQDRHVSRRAICYQIEKTPRLQRARDDAVEEVLDVAEGVVMRSIAAGDANLALRFLELKGKNRGYTRRSEMTGKDGAPLPDAASDVGHQLNNFLDTIASRLRGDEPGRAAGAGAPGGAAEVPTTPLN